MFHEVGLGNKLVGVPILRWVKCISEKKVEINKSSSEKKENLKDKEGVGTTKSRWGHPHLHREYSSKEPSL
jgi:hypothetical protein